MDYEKFYKEVVNWIYEANSNASKFGFQSDIYWKWVIDSVAEICERHNNNDLVNKQMTMLVNWLTDLYNQQKGNQVAN